ncbi:CHASE2 domain-containing protein [Legionella sp. km772]|uniref:CHASE2 domain-containing protein n=1 Tax=Legionella sp. km772 TaxID=2498111 RepID=UPI000F8E3917|nr:CHASE2 domain-containing protein [Legionella sp. km772]RUR04080.1 CHASE2 domain-containing protein [Legionella sp. km772]
MLSALQNAGVVVVGMDMVMSSPEINYATSLKNKLKTMSSSTLFKQNNHINNSTLEQMLDEIAPEVDNDQALARVLKNYDVTLGFLFHNLSDLRVGTLPNPLRNSKGELLNPRKFKIQYFKGYNASIDLLMRASGHGGFVTNMPDSDGIIRRGLLLGSINGKVYPSLALMTAMRFLLADHVDLIMHHTLRGEELYGIDVAGTFIPTNNYGQVLIPFWGGPFTLPYIPATDVLRGNFKAEDLAGAIAIVGSSALLLNDLHVSPVAPIFPGVEVVGNLVTGIIGQQLATIYDWHTSSGVLIITGFGALCAFVIPFLNIFLLIITTILLCIAVIAVCIS